jgi:hypothetical protein
VSLAVSRAQRRVFFTCPNFPDWQNTAWGKQVERTLFSEAGLMHQVEVVNLLRLLI